MNERTRDGEIPYEEAARRRDEALRRALNTPPPIKPIAKPKRVKPAPDKNNLVVKGSLAGRVGRNK